jgi:hypothetical protein
MRLHPPGYSRLPINERAGYALGALNTRRASVGQRLAGGGRRQVQGARCKVQGARCKSMKVHTGLPCCPVALLPCSVTVLLPYDRPAER